MRVAGKGLLDPSREVDFTFDGRCVTGLEGDTVASALLGSGIRLMGRSFKYHRPRGVITAGSDEPNALVTIGAGQAQRPNCRATVEPIRDGLRVRSQNAWPSLERDALAVNDLAWRFLGAGFYYKTFMWPKSFWEKLYEPVIRRAAGLGALSGIHAADDAGKGFLFCDLLVIGAGPAGLMAALVAARAGADVIVADEGTLPGGRLLSEIEEVDGKPGHDWAADMARSIRDAGGRILRRTTVTGAYDGGIYGALERGPIQTFWRITAARAVLAAGALERPIAFRHNDRPGIMNAGAIRTYLNRYGVAAGRRHVIYTNNDDGYRTARNLHAAELSVTVVDSRDDAPAGKDYEVIAGGTVTGTRGRRGLEEVQISSGGATRRLRADCLGVSGGWNPAVHLSCHMNGRPVWRDDIAAFVPAPDAVPGLEAAGAAGGVFDTAGCLRDGMDAAAKALRALRKNIVPVTLPDAEARAYRIEPLWAVPGAGRAWLDFQNDVTVKDVRQAARENFRSVEHMKRYTTQGMATDQGKGGSILALAVLADVTGRAIPETGTTTFRPPFVPVPIKAYGAGARGDGFVPKRLTSSHDASVARGAPMVEAGLWMRASYYPQLGERSWRESCDREVGHVRRAVGVCDVTTLGKIDVQGPDAGALLDFAYAGRMGSLRRGRVRYGVMLREDGHIMDDGTVARLGDQHFLVTTTTVAAGNVMRHMEFVAQCLRPDLDLSLVSVTEQWAQFAIAGPASRRLLDLVLDAPLGDDWPFMSCGGVSVDGVGARLFRISFSGEHAYELAVPARFGDALFRRLVAEAEGLGGGPYGLEALNVLRIEKGFPTHAEMNGRVTLDDLGMGDLLKTDKDCIGQRMAARPGLSGPERGQLVGLRIDGASKGLGAGAHLFAEGAASSPQASEGYVSSLAWSPTLGCTLALGFLRDGRARHGEVLDLRDAMRGVTATAAVADPVAFDPDGGRMRGTA